jgi:hypothetical protein
LKEKNQESLNCSKEQTAHERRYYYFNNSNTTTTAKRRERPPGKRVTQRIKITPIKGARVPDSEVWIYI